MAIALVSHLAENLGPTGGTTSGIDTTGADLLVIGFSYYGGNSLTVSDSKGNTWTALTAVNSASSSVIMYYAKNPTVGTGHTFTGTGGNGTSTGFISACVETFSGVDLTSPFDQQSTGGFTTSTTIQPGSVTPSTDNQVLVTVVTWGPSATTSINGGFTKADYVNFGGGVAQGSSMAYLIQTTAASANPTWTLSTSVELCCAIATFKAASGGGAAPSHLSCLLGVGG